MMWCGTGLTLDDDRFVDVRVAGDCSPVVATVGHSKHVDVLEQPAERIPQGGLFDEAFVERQLGLHRRHERSRVVVQQVAVLGFDLGDARPEDRREVGAGRLPETLHRPRQLHLFDLCAGPTQRVGDRAGVGDDVGIDRPVAQRDAQTDPHARDARSGRVGICGGSRSETMSRQCGPAITFSSSAQSATVRASGPSWQY